MQYQDVYQMGKERLEQAGAPEADLEARLLLEFVCDTDRTTLFAHPEKEVSEEQMQQYEAFLAKRCERVPLSYLIFRSVCTTVVQFVRGKRLGYDYWRSVRDVASHYGVEVKEDECLKINAAVKRFNTTGMGRLLTNVWLSLIPVRAWRLRFCWWSTLPDVKGAVK